MSNQNTETEFWRKTKNSFILCQAKREHSRLAPQELWSPPWGIGRGLIVRTHDQEYVIRIKAVTVLAFFFLLQSFNTTLGLVVSKGGVADNIKVCEASQVVDELLWSL